MSSPCTHDTPGIGLSLDSSDGGLVATPVVSLSLDNGLEVKSDGFYAPDRPAFVSALPTTGNYGGREVFYEALEGLLTWHFRYHGTTSSSNHWQFVGGAPLRDRLGSGVVMSQSGASGENYDDVIGTDGPVSVNVPIQGVYDIAFGCQINNSAVANTYVSVKYSGVGATDDDAVVNFSDNGISVSRILTSVTIPANQNVGLRFRNGTNSTTATYREAWLAVTPVRV